MSMCASCGLQLVGDASICPHHHVANGDEWAASNRAMCNFFHRGVVLERVKAEERDDAYLAAGVG